MTTRLLAYSLVAVILVACGSPTKPDEGRRIGLILGSPDDPHITVPDTVRAGVEFTVTVRTVGLDSCWEKAATEVGIRGLEALVIPYDIDRTEEYAGCWPMVVHLDHTANLRFDRPGTGRVTVRGREDDRVLTFTRTLVVR